MAKRPVLVVGSINMDLLLTQDRLPARGETLVARSVREEFGGKGANQAVQCARLGQRVSFLGAVGDDHHGRASRQNLEDNGIDCHLHVSTDTTGLGFVQILPGGEVHATIVRGANAEVTAARVIERQDLFDEAGVVILQNEIPAEANEAAIRLAHERGALVIYNAAPARAMDPALSILCDFLVVNEEEASFFFGASLDDEAAVRAALPELQEFCRKVVVTMGAAGSLLAIDGAVHRVAPVPAVALDTTGAGDAFVAAFAAAINEGRSESGAARFASEVAAAATLGVGAQTAMPTREVPTDDPVRAQAQDPRPAV